MMPLPSCGNPEHVHDSHSDAQKCRLIENMRHLLLPGLYKLSGHTGDDWELVISYLNPTLRCLWLKREGYGQLFMITTDEQLMELGGTDKARKRWRDIMTILNEELPAGPKPVLTSQRRLAIAIVALINAKPATPSVDEIADLIRGMRPEVEDITPPTEVIWRHAEHCAPGDSKRVWRSVLLGWKCSVCGTLCCATEGARS